MHKRTQSPSDSRFRGNERRWDQPAEIALAGVYIDGMTELPAAVRDNPALSRFELGAEGLTAFANYRLAPGVITFTHTEVPPSLRERGIGSQLVQGALEHARELGLKVAPRCSFVRHYIATHSEFNDLLA
jgi:predicted GNAT family acetyltransferase